MTTVEWTARYEPEDWPLVTFALFTYNQEQFVRGAVEGAFPQTYSPLASHMGNVG